MENIEDRFKLVAFEFSSKDNAILKADSGSPYKSPEEGVGTRFLLSPRHRKENKIVGF